MPGTDPVFTAAIMPAEDQVVEQACVKSRPSIMVLRNHKTLPSSRAR